MLLNELSDNVDVFSAEEKSEFIFHLFRTLAVGGALCQPDTNLNRYATCIRSTNAKASRYLDLLITLCCRYLDLTKDLYKDLVTIYRYALQTYIAAARTAVTCTALLDYTTIISSHLCNVFHHVLRDSKTETVQFSGRVFRINSVTGLELFPDNPHSPLNSLVVVVDVLKKTITVVKNNFKSFW
jgi:hypothetical protein